MSVTTISCSNDACYSVLTTTIYSITNSARNYCSAIDKYVSFRTKSTTVNVATSSITWMVDIRMGSNTKHSEQQSVPQNLPAYIAPITYPIVNNYQMQQIMQTDNMPVDVTQQAICLRIKLFNDRFQQRY